MRIVPLALSCLACASFVPPAAAEPAGRVVSGLTYRVEGEQPGRAQAVRVRAETGKVLVRYENARTAWVDAHRLVAQPQPVAAHGGSYLFVVAALACLLDEQGCARRTTPVADAATRAVPASEAGFKRARGGDESQRGQR